MTPLMRLCYASHATVDPNQIGLGLERLLTQSRTYNQQFGLTGVLYYGKGYFFQCLEGDPQTIDKIYKKIRHDPRHEEIVLLDREPVNQRAFVEPMKVVIINEAIRQAYHSSPEHPFIPTRLRRRDLSMFLDLLQKQPNYDRLSEFQHNSSMTTVVSASAQSPLLRPLVMVLLLMIVAMMAFLLVPFFSTTL